MKMYLDKIGETLIQYCEQNPIRLNSKKLCLPQASKIQITTAQIGWLFAVIEAKAMGFDSIKWTQNLIDRAIELRISYSILAREKLKEDHDSSRKPLWDDDRISVKKYNNVCDYDVVPEYVLSCNMARTFLMSWDSNDITLLEVKRMIAAQRKSMDKVRLMMLSHKDLIDHVRRNLSKLCDNSPVRFDLDKISDGIWLKDIAFYLAITAKKFSEYGDVDYDSVSLWHNAKRIHGLLGDALEEKLPFRLSASECMRLDQRKVTEALGIMEIAKYGNMPESNILNDVWSISVTRNLTLVLIDQLAEFKYLISQEPRIHPDQSKPPKTLIAKDKKNLRFISLPSNKCQERTFLLKKAIEHLLLKDPPDLLNVRCIWQKLLHQQSVDAYKIKEITGGGSKRKITFTSGNSFDYSTATQHIQKAIDSCTFG